MEEGEEEEGQEQEVGDWMRRRTSRKSALSLLIR